MKALAIEWNRPRGTWERMKPQYQAIMKHMDLELATTGATEIDWITVHQIPRPQNWGEIRELLMGALVAYAELPDFDILYARNGGCRRQYLDIAVKDLAGRPALIKMGGDTHAVMDSIPTGHFYMGAPFQKILDVHTLNNFERLVPLSSSMGQVLKSRVLDPDRISPHISLGIDPEKWTESSLPDEFTPGYSGRVSLEKGAQLLNQTAAASPETRIKVAGDIQIPEWAFPKNIDHDGVIPYDEMNTWYDDISLLLLPSFAEVCPNSILEAYMKGRPIMIADDLELPPEIPLIGWRKPRDPQAWADKLEQLKKHPSIIKVFGDNARRYMIRHWPSWDTFGYRMAQELTYTVEQHENPR